MARIIQDTRGRSYIDHGFGFLPLGQPSLVQELENLWAPIEEPTIADQCVGGQTSQRTYVNDAGQTCTYSICEKPGPQRGTWLVSEVKGSDSCTPAASAQPIQQLPLMRFMPRHRQKAPVSEFVEVANPIRL